MSGRPSLFSNVVYSAISWASTFGLLVVHIFAARVLGSERYGRFAFAYALVALFEAATDAGMRDFLVREIARARSRTACFLGEGLVLKTLLTIPTIGLIFLAAALLDLPRETVITIAFLTGAMVAKSYKLALRGTLIAHERFRREAVIATADRILVVVVCSWALFLDGRLLTFAAAFCAAGVTNLVVTVCVVGELRHAVWPRPLVRVMQLLRASLPFGLTAAACLAYFRLDSVMLAFLREETEVGWYNAAYRLTEGLIIIPTVIQYATFPRLSILARESHDSTEAIARRAVKFLAAIAMLVVPVGVILARPMIGLIYGEEYAPSVVALQLLLLGVPFMFVWSILIVLLNATDRPKVPFVGVTVGAILNVVLNLIMIPWLGHLGASLSTVVAEIFLCTFLVHALRQGGYRLNVVQAFARPLLCAALALVAVWLLGPIHFVVAGMGGCLIYLAGLSGTGFFDSTDREVVGRLMRKMSGRSAI